MILFNRDYRLTITRYPHMHIEASRGLLFRATEILRVIAVIACVFLKCVLSSELSIIQRMFNYILFFEPPHRASSISQCPFFVGRKRHGSCECHAGLNALGAASEERVICPPLFPRCGCHNLGS